MEPEDMQQPAISQPSAPVNPLPPQHRSKKIFILVAIILALLIFGIGSYLFGTRNPNNNTSSSKTITVVTLPVSVSISPKLVAFMRNGEIWVKNLVTNHEKKISKTAKVANPKFSPTGQYLYYFQIVHAGGGFPRYSLFINDAQGTSEKTFTKGANDSASKLKWSNDGKYLGMVLFGNDIPGGANYSEEALIYDTSTQKETLLGKIKRNDLSSDQYVVEGTCNQLPSQYTQFCTEYVAYLKVARSTDYKNSYKSEEYSKSKYTKPNYILSRSEKLDNGLVVLEYYTGEPQNPESKWGIGGGVFVPGYDEGVTQTYSILLDETANKVITELPLASDSDFIF